MVYFTELLVVMTDWLKTVKFLLKMYPIHGHKRLDDDAFLASLSHSKKATVLCSRSAGTLSC